MEKIERQICYISIIEIYSLKFISITKHWPKCKKETAITSLLLVLICLNLVCYMLEVWSLWWYKKFAIYKICKYYVILWRHFDVLTSSWRQNKRHVTERPWKDEKNELCCMSLSLLELKLWPTMCFRHFRWPWPWPWPDLQKNS